MRTKKVKFLIALVLGIILFSFFSSFVLAAERGLEVGYPKLDGEEITATTTLPEYVGYIFKFSLIIAGILAFAALIYGGFRYLTSAGSPEVMRDAKSWIFGGILGLVVLLCSYLILITINPELISPKELPPLKPTSGVYLIDARGLMLYFNQDMPTIPGISTIPGAFKAKHIEFLSDRPAEAEQGSQWFADPKKEELLSVFYYSKENWEGEVKEIKNNKDPGAVSSWQDFKFTPKSLRFFWFIPGVYLYENEGFVTPPPPRIYQSSQENLKDLNFNDKAKSIRFVNIKEAAFNYDSVLFQHVDFGGKCDWVNFDQDSLPGSVKNDLSSIAIIRSVAPTKGIGEVIFYDEKACQGNEYTWTWEKEGSQVIFFSAKTFEGTDKVLANNVESFRIEGNFAVVLTTSEELINGKGECAYFPIKGRQPSLEGTSVYCPRPVWLGGCRPQAAFIFTTME